MIDNERREPLGEGAGENTEPSKVINFEEAKRAFEARATGTKTNETKEVVDLETEKPRVLQIINQTCALLESRYRKMEEEGLSNLARLNPAAAESVKRQNAEVYETLLQYRTQGAEIIGQAESAEELGRLETIVNGWREESLQMADLAEERLREITPEGAAEQQQKMLNDLPPELRNEVAYQIEQANRFAAIAEQRLDALQIRFSKMRSRLRPDATQKVDGWFANITQLIEKFKLIPTVEKMKTMSGIEGVLNQFETSMSQWESSLR